jgi:hypothetical protein
MPKAETPKKGLLFCATDKEVFDVLMSSKQRITESVMLDLAKERGIFYSPKDSRETLAHNLSLVPNDYHSLNSVLDRREHQGRAEKVTSVTLNAALTIDDIKEVSKQYREEAAPDEKVLTNQNGPDRYVVTVNYTEIDYAKTRLVQRRQKEAAIEFFVEDGKTVVRMPANPKAKEVVVSLKNRLDGRKKTDIPTESIELSGFAKPDTRTRFFTMLIGNLTGFSLFNVTSVRVESGIEDSDDDDLESEGDQDAELAKQEMLAVVRNVALKGQSLLASGEYQQLRAKGFFITSIIWRSKQASAPFPVVEFEAGFEDPKNGVGFKYNVRGITHLQEGEYGKTLKPVAADDRLKYLTMIESTARQSLARLRDELDGASEAGSSDGGIT